MPDGSFGPRLRATLGVLAAEFRLAKRPVRRLAGTLMGLDISTGVVAKLERQTAIVLEAGRRRAGRGGPGRPVRPHR